MPYEPELLRLANAALQRRRDERQDRFIRRRDRIYGELPEVERIDRELRSTMARLMGQAFQKGEDVEKAVTEIKIRNLALQDTRRRLLQQAGYSESDLDQTPYCENCGDTGYMGAVMCRCLKELYSIEQKKKLSDVLKLGDESFDTFCFDYYSPDYDPDFGISPRKNMELVYEICVDYTRKFGKTRGSLFFSGGTGLGKTFLAACIAREVSDQGFSVVYDTAVSVFDRFEAVKFGGRGGVDEATDIYLTCDLLILDDLGTEMTTQFTQSVLYTIVNTRLTRPVGTVMTSNLTMEEMRRRYTPQTMSRIEGEYMNLFFFGQDIRMQKKKQRFG